MKITIKSTTKIVHAMSQSQSEQTAGVRCRVWEGETESGIKVQALIPRIAAEAGQDLSQFERELQECEPPSAAVQAFPLRMIL